MQYNQDINAVEVFNNMARQSEYNAMANTSFVSPAVQKKTKGFVDFDLQLFRPEG
jgi:hypothetical protein